VGRIPGGRPSGAAGLEDDDAWVLVGDPVEVVLPGVGEPAYAGVALVEYDVPDVVLLHDAPGLLPGGVLERPQGVQQRSFAEGGKVAGALDAGVVVGLHLRVAAHRQHPAARDVVEVGGGHDAATLVVLLEPGAGGGDVGRGGPVLGALARARRLLQVARRLDYEEPRRKQGRRERYREGRPGRGEPRGGAQQQDEDGGRQEGEGGAKVAVEAVWEARVARLAADEEEDSPDDQGKVRQPGGRAVRAVWEEHHGAEEAEPEDGGRDRHEQVRRVVGRLGAYSHRHGLAPPARLGRIAKETGDEVGQVVGVPGESHRQHEQEGERAGEG